MPETVFASPAGAADALDAALDHLAAVDWASLGTAAHEEAPQVLPHARQSLLSASAVG